MATTRVPLWAFERDEFVAEHHFRGDAAEEFRVDALLAEIDEWAAIALGQASRLIALGGVVWNAGGYWRICCGH